MVPDADLRLECGTHQERVFTYSLMHSTEKCIDRTGGQERHASTHIQAEVSQHAQHEMHLEVSFTCSGTDSGSVGALRRGCWRTKSSTSPLRMGIRGCLDEHPLPSVMSAEDFSECCRVRLLQHLESEYGSDKEGGQKQYWPGLNPSMEQRACQNIRSLRCRTETLAPALQHLAPSAV